MTVAAAERFPALEGYRGLAALSIVAYHTSIDTRAVLSGPWGWGLARLDVGVAVFFVLSGFLLSRPLVVAHLRDEPPRPVGRFWRNRLLRIFPAWWLVLVVVGALGRIELHSPIDGALYALLLVGYVPNLLVVNALFQSWTLTVELAFYLLLPAYAAVLRRVGGDAERRVRAHLAGAGLLYVVGNVVRWLVAVAVPGHPALITLPAQVDLFALGMAVAAVSAGAAVAGRSLPRPLAFAARHPGLCVAGAGIAFWVLATQAGLPRQLDLTPLSAGQEVRRHLLFGAVAIAFVLPGLAGEGGRWRAFLATRPLAFLGAISYGMYLWHVDVLRTLVRNDGPFDEPFAFRFWLTLGTTTALTVAIATASYFFVERPALRWKR